MFYPFPPFQETKQPLEYTEQQESNESDLASSYQTFQVFVMCTALLILFLSLTWLLANSAFKKAELRQSYSRFVSFRQIKIPPIFRGILEGDGHKQLMPHYKTYNVKYPQK